MQTRTRRQALAEGLTAGVLFGTAAVLIRFVQGLGPFSIVFWRLVVACVALTAVLLVFGRSFQLKLVRENSKELLGLSLLLGLHFVFFTSAVRDTTILNATVLVSTTPVLSMLVSSFVFKVKPSSFAFAGLMISFAGVFFIAYGETTVARATGQTVSPTLRGDLEAVVAAGFEAFYLNYGRKVRREMSLLSAMLPMYVFAAVVVGLLGATAGNTYSPSGTFAEAALPLVGLGLIPTAVAHTLYFSSLSNLKSFETATMSLLEPVGATLLGIAAFRETPAPVFVLGAVLVLTGIFFVVKERR